MEYTILSVHDITRVDYCIRYYIGWVCVCDITWIQTSAENTSIVNDVQRLQDEFFQLRNDLLLEFCKMFGSKLKEMKVLAKHVVIVIWSDWVVWSYGFWG